MGGAYTLVVARFLLVAVFATAAVTKLAAQPKLRSTLVEFGLPVRLAPPAAMILPTVEVVVATLVLPTTTARLGAIGGLVLLVIFSAAIVWKLVRGKRPECGCFGELQPARVGPRTLLRNALLAALAGAIASRPVNSIGWVELGVFFGSALVAAQAWLWFTLLRRYGRALRRIEVLEEQHIEPAVLDSGDQAPPFVLQDIEGRTVTLESLVEQSSGVTLLFTNPGCSACDVVLRDVERGAWPFLVVVATGEHDAVADEIASYHLGTVLLDLHGEVGALYGIAAVPTAVAVGPDGLVTNELAVGVSEVRELLRHQAVPVSRVY